MAAPSHGHVLGAAAIPAPRRPRSARAPLSDLSLDLAAGEYPVVTGVFFRRRGKPPGELAVGRGPLDRLASAADPGRGPGGGARNDARPTCNRSVLLDRDVMDALILDLPRRQSMRANDLWLEEVEGRLLLRAADIGPWAVLRRLGHGVLGHGIADRHLLDWRDVEFLRGDPRAAREGRDYHRRVSTLQPPEIANLLDALPYLHAAELLTLLPDPLAADTLEVMQAERQVQVFEELDDDQQLRLLQLMAPDNTADLLDRLGTRARHRAARTRCPRRSARRPSTCCAIRADTAGGIMTNDIVRRHRRSRRRAGAPGDPRRALRRPGLHLLRVRRRRPRVAPSAGRLTLRDLLVADDDAPVREVMHASVVSLDPLMPALAAARAVAEQHLAALPVVSRDGRVLGAVTADSALVQIAPPSLSGDTPRVFS